jgi:hypothetical protein
MDNRTIASKLLDYAHYLAARNANLYRVQAYRRAAETVFGLDQPATHLVTELGRTGLEALPGIGSHLSYTIEGLVRTGEFRTLDAEGGHTDAESLLASLPGIGRQLARRIHDELGIETLEQLEQAAHDGRLSRLQVGPKRLRGIIDALAGRFRRRPVPPTVQREPSVADLLAIDQEYRALTEQGKLPLLTPRRFNPNQEPWLPLLRTRRDEWYYRALFSNTPLAHQLGKTRDWVVIYFSDRGVSGQRTVVTETRGRLEGQRIVRGRERECREHYAAMEQSEATQPVGAAAGS